MLRAILIIVAAIGIFCLGGCKKGPSESDSEQGVVVKSVAEYQEEADELADEYEEEMAETADEYQQQAAEVVDEQQEEVLKTSVEYQEDAQREITLANMEAELRRIEEELKRDLAEDER
jgi:phage host-nuclease inhibitor protein Gam